MHDARGIGAFTTAAFSPDHWMLDISNANNTAGLLVARFLAAFSQPTHIVVSSLQLIYGSLVSLTDFLGSCAQAGCKLTARFSSLSSPLSSTPAFSRLTARYYTLLLHQHAHRPTSRLAEKWMTRQPDDPIGAGLREPSRHEEAEHRRRASACWCQTCPRRGAGG